MKNRLKRGGFSALYITASQKKSKKIFAVLASEKFTPYILA
jgi:hypothetical protein